MKKSIGFVISFLVFTCCPIKAQEIQQLYSFYSSADSKAKSTCFSESGSAYISGEFSEELFIGFNSANPWGLNSIYLSKQTSNGEIPFLSSFTGSGEVFVSAIQVHGDSVIVGGTFSDSLFFDTDTLYNSNFKGIYIAVFDTLGNFQSCWTTESYSAELYDLKINDIGQIIACGEFFGSFQFGSEELNANLGFNSYVFTLDKETFQPIWIDASNGTATNAKNVDFDSSNDIYIVGSYGDGTTIQGQTLPGVSGDHNLFLAKYSSIGDLIWIRTLTGPVQNHGLSLAVSESGDIYIGGEYEMTLDIPQIGTLFNEALMDGFVVKLDTEGEFQWAQNIGTSDNDASIQISMDNQDNPVVLSNVGQTLTVGSMSINSNGFFDPCLIKFDKNTGIPLWHFRIPSAPSSGIVKGYSFDLKDSLITICGSNRTGIYYSGEVLDSPNIDDSFWAVIKDSTFIEDDLDLTELKDDSFSIFPNPCKQTFTLNNIDLNYKIELFDNKATIQKLTRQGNNTFHLDSDLPSGIYILRISNEETTIHKRLIHL